MNLKTFPEPVVKELRRENKRRRQRCAGLEEALKRATFRLACLDAGLEPGDVPADSLSVDEEFRVVGIEDALRKHAAPAA